MEKQSCKQYKATKYIYIFFIIPSNLCSVKIFYTFLYSTLYCTLCSFLLFYHHLSGKADGFQLSNVNSRFPPIKRRLQMFCYTVTEFINPTLRCITVCSDIQLEYVHPVHSDQPCVHFFPKPIFSHKWLRNRLLITSLLM